MILLRALVLDYPLISISTHLNLIILNIVIYITVIVSRSWLKFTWHRGSAHFDGTNFISNDFGHGLPFYFWYLWNLWRWSGVVCCLYVGLKLWYKYRLHNFLFYHRLYRFDWHFLHLRCLLYNRYFLHHGRLRYLLHNWRLLYNRYFLHHGRHRYLLHNWRLRYLLYNWRLRYLWYLRIIVILRSRGFIK